MNQTLSITPAPTGAPDLRDQLAKLLRTRVARDAIYPLSPAQLSMWFHQNLEQDSSSFNMPFAFCMRGARLNPDRVHLALKALVARHPVLRTVFEMDNEEVVQRVKPSLAFALPLHDASATMGEQWRTQVVAMSKGLSTDAFDLTTGPLFRFELVRVSADMHVLLATFHHIVMDGWSVGVFLGDFAQAYQSYRDTGEAPAWSALPVSYGDYARQRHAAARGPEAATAIDYWRARLKDAPEALSLPADFARPAVQTFNGAIVDLPLPLRLKQQMTDIARDNGATFFMLSLAAFYVLMARLSGQWDLILGVASANRSQAEHRGMLGLFSEILPMRAAIDANLSFLDFLETIKRDCLNDYQHAAPALTELVEAMSGNRDARRSNLFQVGFDYQNTPWPALGDVVTLLHGDTGASKLDLNLNLSTVPGGMLAQFEYNTDLFSAEAMGVFAGCFETLLESIMRDPYTPLSGLRITRAAPAAPAGEGPAAGADVLQLVEARAAATPHAVAVRDLAGSLDYATLVGRANALAWTLRERGAGPGTLVGLCCERSAEMIVAMLAILKAGAAYVPMDAGFPLSRLEYIVGDAGLKLVVTREDQLSALAGLDGVALITEAGVTARAVAPPSRLADSDLAYVLYTSGTTGQPKGVMVSHGALRHFVVPAIERLALTAGETMLQFASISFDASVEEIFPTLASGATLLMRAPGLIGSVDSFLQMCEQHAVTVLDLPTAFWHELVDALAAPAAPRLPAAIRLVVIGGEAASPKLLATWLATVGRNVKLQNTYGPTETTVCVTTAELTTVVLDAGTSVGLPIGRANPHVQIYVLDPRGVQVPAGVYGEIFIGGDTLAAGYLGRAELSAQKFIPDTFRPRPGGTLFRSGDYGRVAADGSLEFKGRKDGQIKLRGFRVELGEVEAIIGSHPEVHHVCADLRDAGDESLRSLVAFVVLKEGATLSAAALKRWLAERSPDYLVPSALQVIDKFPYGVTGKIDRDALLTMLAPADAAATHETRAPTPTEEILIGIWEGVLGVSGIGIEDNFFERGGHSLLMIKMLSRVRRLLDADVPLAQVFEAPTVSRFAERVDALRMARRGDDVAIARQPRNIGASTSFPQSSSQQRLWFHEKLNPDTVSYNVPVAFSARGELALEVFEASIDELVARHEILRTTFTEIDGQALQCIAPDSSVKLCFTDLSALAEPMRDAELERLIALQANARFDLERGPLLRAAIYKLAEQDFVIAFAFHHIVIDDWSLTLFLGELRDIYGARLAGSHRSRREAGLQYADFSQWQHEQADGELAQAQLAYWRTALAGVPERLQLPTDRPRPATQSHAGATYSWNLAPQLARGLRSLARQHGVTLHMVLLSAWVAALARLSGQHDIVVGIPVANRPHGELENLLGFFVNTLPLRVQVGPADTLLALLGQVKSNSLAAYANQGAQLERIVEAVRPQRDLGFNPLFVTMFALQPTSSAAFTLGQLTLRSRELESRQCKVDVSMTFGDDGDQLSATIEYALDLYDEATMVRWSGFVGRVLEALVADAGTAPASVDYAQWQRGALTAAMLQRQLGYWEQQLAGLPLLHNVPLDHPRPAVQSGASAAHAFGASRATTDGLRRLAAKHDGTLFMVIHAAFSLLLARHAGSNDVVIGASLAKRPQQVEPLTCIPANTLVLRSDCVQDCAFTDYLAHIRSVNMAARAHQDIPFELLVERLAPQGGVSHAPLFQIMLNMADGDERGGSDAGPASQAMLDLSLSVVATDAGLALRFDYNQAMFDAPTVARLGRRLTCLLDAIVADPASPVHALPIIDVEERNYVLNTLNATTAPFPQEACIDSLFEAQAARSPDAAAVQDDAGVLTYAQLNERANRLAHHLVACGVGPESLVGVCMERSAHSVVALLAILKAGGAYVALDPRYPEQRLADMVDDSGLAWVLTQASLLERLSVHPMLGRAQTALLALDAPALAATLAQCSPTNPARPANPGGLAYLIYTSGSTGRPKAVAICHRNTVAMISWAAGAFSARERRRVLFSTSLNFDLSVFELFVPLSLGGTVVVVADAMALLDKAYGAALDISLLNTVPSACRALVDSRAIPASVCVVNLAGEALPPALVNALFDCPQVERVCNLYGPSEDTTYSSHISYSGKLDGAVSIGRPIDNTRFYLLDPYGQPVPLGVAGEIYIGGAGVALGYLNRPELTAQRFLADPFGEPGERMYRTGDLGRWLADGTLEYLGRNDFQVKLRGFRIELGEIEACLCASDGVREAVVVAREDAPGQPRLVAYLCLTAGQLEGEVQAAARAALGKALPDYMMPSAFVVLPTLPLNANGKVERKALPAPLEVTLARAFTAPETPLEQLVATVWSELLQAPRVGLDDDFFVAGGHSILASRMTSRLKATLAVDFTLQQLFRQPTIRGIVAGLKERVANFDELEEVARTYLHILNLSPEEVASMLDTGR